MHQAIVKRIRLLCDEYHLNPHSLSREAALPPTTIKNILMGASKHPGAITIKKICDGVGISVYEFFDHEVFHSVLPKNEAQPPKPFTPPKDMHGAIAERLYWLCCEKRLDPQRWGELAGLSKSSVNNILSHRSKNTSVELLKDLCDVIGMSIIEFFDHELFHNLDLEVEHEQD